MWGPFYLTNMKTIAQLAELNVCYQLSPEWGEQPIIGSSREAYEVIFPFFPNETIALQEHFIVAYMNRGNRLIGVYQMSKGGVSSTVADAKIILATALKVVACSMILSHNHPSGALKPSESDIDLTNRLKEGAKLLDISVLDHIIVTSQYDAYFSFADEGII